MKGASLLSKVRLEDVHSEMSKCCGAVLARNVGTNRSGVENDLEWTRSGVFTVLLERVGSHILAFAGLFN